MGVTADEPSIERGWVAPALAAEFPDLGLASTVVPMPGRRSGSALRERLAMHADRFHGARAVSLRREPVVAAHRVFFRHLGLDPDVDRTPVEAVALQRLLRGGFGSRGPLPDALLLAVLETGVATWALDDARLEGAIGLRPTDARERLGTGEYADDLPAGRIVVADARGPVAVLFGEVAPSHRPTRETRRLRLFAVAVPGVPTLHVEEALWVCAEALAEA